MTKNQKRELLRECMFLRERREFEGMAVNDLSDVPNKYQGLVLHVNDHGNVSLYRAFKNGSFHYIYGIV